jgi:hypothetical protein
MGFAPLPLDEALSPGCVVVTWSHLAETRLRVSEGLVPRDATHVSTKDGGPFAPANGPCVDHEAATHEAAVHAVLLKYIMEGPPGLSSSPRPCILVSECQGRMVRFPLTQPLRLPDT